MIPDFDRPCPPRGARGGGQVRLLAEHCFTLSDEAVQSLVRYRIPSQSRWDLKQKLHVRDETIKHLQRALDLLNQEKQRFKTACVDIETGLQVLCVCAVFFYSCISARGGGLRRCRENNPLQAGVTAPFPLAGDQRLPQWYTGAKVAKA